MRTSDAEDARHVAAGVIPVILDRVTNSLTMQQSKTTFRVKKTRVEDGRKIAAYSTALNLLLAFVKGGLAAISGSKAILAETIHSFTDVIGSLAVLVGIIISRKKSPNFPWGLYKVENIAAIISAFFILIAAYEVSKSVLLSNRTDIANIDISLIVLLFMIIPIFFFARYEKKEAEKMNSPSLMADAHNWMADMAPLGIVIAGIAGSSIFSQADKVAAAVIIIFILKATYDIVKDSMKSLLDASVDSQTLDKIREIIANFKEVETVKSLHARNSGSFVFVHLNLQLSVTRLKDAHQISENIEEAIKSNLPFVEMVIVHYEPEKKDFIRFAVPLANKSGMISDHFGEAPYIALWDKKISDNTFLNREILQNPFINIIKGKGIKLAEFLVHKGVDVLYTRKKFEHKGPEYVFSNFDVELRNTDYENVSNFLNAKKDMIDVETK
jgi:cation diffusion facilitator family transporter